MSTQIVPFNIKIYTRYGTFLATTEYYNNTPPSYDAIKVGSMNNGAYPPLENMTFHGDYAVAYLAKPIMGNVRE